MRSSRTAVRACHLTVSARYWAMRACHAWNWTSRSSLGVVVSFSMASYSGVSMGPFAFLLVCLAHEIGHRNAECVRECLQLIHARVLGPTDFNVPQRIGMHPHVFR